MHVSGLLKSVWATAFIIGTWAREENQHKEYPSSSALNGQYLRVLPLPVISDAKKCLT